MQTTSLRRVKYSRLENAQQPKAVVDALRCAIDSPGHSHDAAVGNIPHDCDLLAHISPIQSLPHHLLDRVLDGVSPEDLTSALLVCKAWHNIIQQDHYKCKRLTWHHKSFVQPGCVANFRTRKRLLSCTAERRLNEVTECIGKTMLLQF